MKTNISALMNLIKEKENKYNLLYNTIMNHVYNTTIEELDGKTNLIENNKNDFDEEIKEFEKLSIEISLLKRTLYDKNNSFKLSDGRTIQSAIVENTNLRKQKELYEELINFKSNKKRISEVNNSYFEVKKINFDTNEIKDKIKKIDDIIQNTDFEISKLNSIEFDINISGDC